MVCAIDWMFMSCPSSHSYVETYPQCNGIWRWGPWERIRSWGSTLMNGIREGIKETPESSFILSTMWRHSGKLALYGPGSRFPPLTKTAGLILNFTSTLRQKPFLVHKLPSLWYSVIALWTKTVSELYLRKLFEKKPSQISFWHIPIMVAALVCSVDHLNICG